MLLAIQNPCVQYEGEERAERYIKFRPKTPLAVVDCIIGYLKKQEFKAHLHLALDVGCGSGQCTDLLAPYFDSVLGIDISEAQIKKANEIIHPPNVEFRVRAAEQLQSDIVQSGSAQLVNVAMAAHWFDLPLFYKEVDKVLCPNGILAMSAYSEIPSFEPCGTKASAEITSAHETLFYNKLGPYFESRAAKHMFSEYADIVIPYQDFTRMEVWVDESCTVADKTRYISSLCGFHNYCAVNGDTAGQLLLDEFASSLRKALGTGEPPEKVVINYKTKYFILIGRKPARPVE